MDKQIKELNKKIENHNNRLKTIDEEKRKLIDEENNVKKDLSTLIKLKDKLEAIQAELDAMLPKKNRKKNNTEEISYDN